jgi:DNA repair protein RecO (recombination protein O)
MPRLVTPAVVLRTVDYGEADRVVTLLTRDGGKRAAIARAARKSTRRFGAGLSLFGVGEATLVERPQADLDTLEAFHGARGFPSLMLDVAKVAHGGYAVELTRELVPPRQPEPEIFDLLVTLLGILDAAPARAETLRVFELNLLDAVGLRPTVDRCVACGRDHDLDGAGQLFDLRRGGVVCGPCHGHGRPLDGAARRALAEAQALTLAQAETFSLAPTVNAACRDVLATLITDHLGRPLKSLEFIGKLNHAHLT